MQKILSSFSLALLPLSSIPLIALQMKPLGLLLLSIGFVITFLVKNSNFKKYFSLLYVAVFLLGIAPISTSIEPHKVISMGVLLLSALFLPYLISNYVYKDKLITFSFRHEKKWGWKEIGYICFTGAIMYLLLPICLRLTDSYLNWHVEPTLGYLTLFFIGINAVGIYDEVFFMGTILKVLKQHVPFFFANLSQSVIFTSFLYELGFREGMFIGVFIFAFLQGYVFKKTNSLFYLVTIHLTADFVLYLALIHAYYPELLPIFLIK